MSRAGGGAAGNGLRAAGGLSSYAEVLNTSGDHLVVAGVAGRRTRLLWVAFVPAGSNTADNLVTIKFESAASGLYTGYALAHWEPFVSAVGKGIVVSTATSEPVAVTLHYDTVGA